MSELFLYSLDSGETLLHFRADDDVTSVTLTPAGGGPQPITDFIRDPWDGARVFQTTLTFTGDFTLTATRPPQPNEIFYGTSLNAIFDIPPVRNWNLPPWLPYKDRVREIFESAGVGLPSDLIDAVDPRRAAPVVLEQHTKQFGIQVFPGESYESLRARVLALASGKHTTRQALEDHLKAICGCPVTIADGMTSAIQANRTGPIPLDGTRNLGGHDSGIYRYRIRLPRRPLVTYGELAQELERVRPAGIRYEVYVSHAVVIS